MGPKDTDAKRQDLGSPIKKVTVALPQNARSGDIIVHVDGKNHAISQADVCLVIKVDRDEQGAVI